MSMTGIWVIRRYDATLYEAAERVVCRSVVASYNGLCILCPDAHSTAPFTRASAAARPDSAARAHAAQGRAATTPHGQTRRQATDRTQAPGVAHARAAIAAATHPGVGDDRGRVHERGRDLLALPGAHGGDRSDRGHGRGNSVRGARQPAHVRHGPGEPRHGGPGRGAG